MTGNDPTAERVLAAAAMREGIIMGIEESARQLRLVRVEVPGMMARFAIQCSKSLDLDAGRFGALADLVREVLTVMSSHLDDMATQIHEVDPVEAIRESC